MLMFDRVGEKRVTIDMQVLYRGRKREREKRMIQILERGEREKREANICTYFMEEEKERKSRVTYAIIRERREGQGHRYRSTI